jgi:hypothetical protein
MSRGGVGAHSPEPMDHTEPVLLFFPPMGAWPGCDIQGRVVRCTRHADRFAIGIAFDQPWVEPEEIRPRTSEY